AGRAVSVRGGTPATEENGLSFGVCSLPLRSLRSARRIGEFSARVTKGPRFAARGPFLLSGLSARLKFHAWRLPRDLRISIAYRVDEIRSSRSLMGGPKRPPPGGRCFNPWTRLV